MAHGVRTKLTNPSAPKEAPGWSTATVCICPAATLWLMLLDSSIGWFLDTCTIAVPSRMMHQRLGVSCARRMVSPATNESS
ncbi:hypothetical protein AB1Y20_013231 [Prymnesium parvum]|uniref:Uncharacterized protein n=1 Tax=Prymnesium parvum TaxID=97485 RepID=A0AB34INN3_PRYPA